MAAKTWSGEWWEVGGGGTVWDAMTYDAELGRVHRRTGNGAPWTAKLRNPGKRRHLFLVVDRRARADTGKYLWHYQTKPDEAWDYTARRHMISSRRPSIDGTPAQCYAGAQERLLLRDRPRDRRVPSPTTTRRSPGRPACTPIPGRPDESTLGNYDDGMKMISPSPLGGHNWQPMAFDPSSQLVFFPVHEMPGAYSMAKGFTPRARSWNTGTGFEANLKVPDGWSEVVKGRLVAWDPIKQREVWRAEYKSAWNGGVLATAGDLVFEGTADGRFVAYRASDGTPLWQSPAGTGIVAQDVDPRPPLHRADGERLW